MDEQLRHIERVLLANKFRSAAPAETTSPEAARMDAPHAGPPAWHVRSAKKPTSEADSPAAESRGWFMGLAIGAAVSLGGAALVCGAALLVWSMAMQRQELWTVGMPIALGGQVVLLVGLVMQLNRLWSDSRSAAGKLDKVDEQLRELKNTTTLLGTTHGPAATSFYSHLAGGASPQILLGDLKSQLDILAMKLGQE
jgi:hypothetical protein